MPNGAYNVNGGLLNLVLFRGPTMNIPQSWQAHGVLPEHLSTFKALAQEQRGKDRIDSAAILEKLPDQLKALGQVYDNSTHSEFTGYTDGEGDVFFLDLQEGSVVLGIGWRETRFASEVSGVILRKLDGMNKDINLFTANIHYR